MKVKALVVAAMVITSVNASWHRKGEDTKIREFDSESHVYQAIISEMENRAAWVSAKQVEIHYESYNAARAKLEASKEKSNNLKGRYRRIFENRGSMNCDEEVFRLISENDGILFSPI
ncbi:hypothetical protein BASA60_003441 [Batrachochytrium salamandrivorans]|nr:hypothetical protein BASA60_003441 [Batrachochytrium salamandrivorans]